MIILDGPMGTELEARGVALPLPAWSARAVDLAPDVITAIHREYAAAGATVHTAATFRTTRRAVGDRWEALARRAVALTRDAVPPAHLVAGSVAPLQDCYRPHLAPPPGVARPEHAELARVLVDAGVDLLLCETFAAPDEAVAAVEGCVTTGVETWVALTAGPDATLLSPDALADAARRCVDAGARVVLVNCVAATRLAPYVERLARVGVPFGAYGNAGAPADRIGFGADEGAARYAALAAAWADLGATIVGGCCYTTPAHVAALARAFTPRGDTA